MTSSKPPSRESVWVIFLVFLRLGLTSFGGPVAHLAYFRSEFVARRCWLSERGYADMVALCQFLPGPASSQVGMALGLVRGGFFGAIAAWAGFTLPSAVLMTLFAMSLTAWGQVVNAGVLHGLKAVAVAVVAQAVWGMARQLCTSVTHITLAVVAACTVLLWPSAAGQMIVMAVAAVAGVVAFKPIAHPLIEPFPTVVSRVAGMVFIGLFFVLLIGLPMMAAAYPNPDNILMSGFYRAGALVFGGGHVMLPLLQATVVPNGLVDNAVFMAGYGASQAVPGPLSTFAAFLGASMTVSSGHWQEQCRIALLCLSFIFLPSFLLIFGVFPFWETLRRSQHMQAALSGINAAVVGVLLAALYYPVWTSAVFTPADFGLVLVAFVALMFWKLPPWLVVAGGGCAGWLLGMVV